MLATMKSYDAPATIRHKRSLLAQLFGWRTCWFAIGGMLSTHSLSFPVDSTHPANPGRLQTAVIQWQTWWTTRLTIKSIYEIHLVHEKVHPLLRGACVIPINNDAVSRQENV